MEPCERLRIRGWDTESLGKEAEGAALFGALPDADVVDGEGLGKDLFVEGTSPVGGVAQGKIELEVVGGSEGIGAVGAIGEVKIVSEIGFAVEGEGHAFVVPLHGVDVPFAIEHFGAGVAAAAFGGGDLFAAEEVEGAPCGLG